jgi:hypothetical protein
MPIEDSMGNYRMVKSHRPLTIAKQYIYRLKQYAEEKFSATSLSSTNTRNENSKSKASNMYKALYPRTPIRFGEMEVGDMMHIGPEIVVQMLMLYSTSPQARKLCISLLTGDPFKIDVRLDDVSKNRSVETVNNYLKTMGLRLVFKRFPKETVNPLLIEPIEFLPKTEEIRKPGELIDPLEVFKSKKDIWYNKDFIQRTIDYEKEIHPLLVDPFRYYN